MIVDNSQSSTQDIEFWNWEGGSYIKHLGGRGHGLQKQFPWDFWSSEIVADVI